MPLVRPFRALRYESEAVGDLALVVSPPYDVIGPAQHAALLARHPRNIVRLDLPAEEPGDEPDQRYRRAARTFAQWRSDGTFHKERRPALYAYEQRYVVPGTTLERVQRGFFGRLRLEPFGSSSGVLAHERTLAVPREDRYRLLRATGANFSPVVGLYADSSGRSGEILASIVAGPPDADVRDDDGVRHRLWIVPEAEGGDGGTDGAVGDLARVVREGPITIADGHHRYETAVRYRDERRMTRSCDEDPPFDYILMLFLETAAQTLTILPTHRVALGLGDVAVVLIERAGALFDVRAVADSGALERAFGPESAVPSAPGGRGRIGLWTRSGGAVLEARREAFEPYLPAAGEALRRLDVTLVGVALERLTGIGREETAAGRVAYTRSAAEAIAAVSAGEGGADAAFLLEPTPLAGVIAVAAAGDVMPQKSTYFYPKPLSGLLVNPHEW